MNTLATGIVRTQFIGADVTTIITGPFRAYAKPLKVVINPMRSSGRAWFLAVWRLV